MATRLEVVRVCSKQAARILIEPDYSRHGGKDNVSDDRMLREVT